MPTILAKDPSTGFRDGQPAAGYALGQEVQADDFSSTRKILVGAR